MREIITCRFESKDDLDLFCLMNNIDVNSSTKEYTISTGNRKDKKTLQTNKKPNMRFFEDWKEMPLHDSKEQIPYAVIDFYTKDKDLEFINIFFDQKITDKTRSVWFPKLIHGKYAGKRFVGGEYEQRYPIYIVSKNRPKECTTSRFLSQMEVPHFVVVEKQDIESYSNNLDLEWATIIELDKSYQDEYDTCDDLGDTKSKGPGPARNFCWDDSIRRGYEYHWVMDDNTREGFHYLYKNEKIKLRTGAFFNAVEDFVLRYKNVAISGLNYSKFVLMSERRPPFITNTRIYSYLFIKNDIPYRWRGRYNEDTDLSLRVLKDGYNTIQFNTFLAGKNTTQTTSGGNSKEFYDHEGTLPKSQMIADLHPDVARVSWKFNRWHHEVNYSGFTKELELKDGLSFSDTVNNYGMFMIDTDEKETTDSRKYLEDKYLGGKRTL